MFIEGFLYPCMEGGDEPYVRMVVIDTNTQMSEWARSIYKAKYSMDGKEEWTDTAHRVATSVMTAVPAHGAEVSDIERFIAERKFIPGGRYLYAAGRDLHQVNNCLLMRADDTREGWSELQYKASMALMTGAGIGVDYSDVRPRGTLISRTGGEASGPCELMQIINEIGRHVMQGGSRRSAIWAGLSWQHPDIQEFIHLKDWPDVVRQQKEVNFNFPATMDMTNISVILDDEFFIAYHDETHAKHTLARTVYWDTLMRMVRTAEPGFSIDTGENAGETLRNACTEVTSRDDSDICNLGSINLARIGDLSELEEVVNAASHFLVAGSVYSHLPYEKVHAVRQKNRRLGLGLMGMHEWLAVRGKTYGPDNELASWLEVYERSGGYANAYCDAYGLSRSVKTRAIAPTGTIGIVGETTTGIEPIFCTAFKRRYLAGGKDWKYQYVVDPTAKRLWEAGHTYIEDAYSLAGDVERRVKFQGWVQQYVDHGISSTINLPHVLEGDEAREFGEMLMKYLPHVRGVTCYPDGARGGQPLTPVALEQAIGQEGVVFEETDEKCVGGVCGA